MDKPCEGELISKPNAFLLTREVGCYFPRSCLQEMPFLVQIDKNVFEPDFEKLSRMIAEACSIPKGLIRR